jgi:fructose-1,6-bisphosphatase
MDLKKGKFNLEINHEYGCDTVCAKGARIIIIKGIATFECCLVPVDSNQRMDADEFEEKEFKNVEFFSLMDEYIRKRFSSFIKNHEKEITDFRFVLKYGESYSFACKIQAMNPDGIMFHV